MTYYSLVKAQGRRFGFKGRVETNGQMDGGDCITCHINAVGKNAPVLNQDCQQTQFDCYINHTLVAVVPCFYCG